ncbi:YceI family protein [Blastococcus brunescens]|uniref:YceI family protein n=1 Tax=Blastococcus brunescens TaxID=1564165 RepID=A0ABZ1ATS1_9ACTN|nr:YceI family protein [Blastococcus sp. BMG 8361]WRL61980.1 YceI family protein [Blastococcus sp. BMG 8361]
MRTGSSSAASCGPTSRRRCGRDRRGGRPVLAAGTWRVSDSRTRVTFAVGNLGRPAHGSVACSWGELEVDDDGRPVRVRAELDLDSLDTGIAKRDADLRKPRFLDIDRRPTMTWSADRFWSGEDGRWTADGVLHVRGSRRPSPSRASWRPARTVGSGSGERRPGPGGRGHPRAPLPHRAHGRDRRRRVAQPPLPGVSTAGGTPDPGWASPPRVRGIRGARSVLNDP